jgi:outer membrane protein TolC
MGRVAFATDPATAPVMANEGIVPLSSLDAVRMALANNYDYALVEIESGRADAQLAAAEGAFEPVIALDLRRGEKRSPATSAFADPKVTEESADTGSAWMGGLAPTGGTYNLSLTVDKQATNSRYSTIDPAYHADATLTLIQPLLKGGGWNVTRWQVISAEQGSVIANLMVVRKAQELVHQTLDAYYDLIYEGERLKTEQNAMAQTVEFKRLVDLQIDAGSLEPIAAIEADTAVAQRKRERIDAQVRRDDAVDRLLALIDPAMTTRYWDEGVVVDEPIEQYRSNHLGGVKETIATALENRPDLKAARLAVEQKQIALGYYDNQATPSLDLFGTLTQSGVRGMARETVDFSTGQTAATTGFNGTVDDAIGDVGSGKWYDYTFGVMISMPLTLKKERARAAEARFELTAEVLAVKKKEQEILLEVRSAHRAVLASVRRVDAAVLAHDLATRRLAAEQVKFQEGASTPFILLTYQNDLFYQEVLELFARLERYKAFERLRLATGGYDPVPESVSGPVSHEQ